MRFGSVCSGIEAASVAWEPLGWTAAWFAEVDRAASEVLAHRFPDVSNHGDMTLLAAKVLAGEIEAPDVLVGGTPCQAYSVAGRRQGLADERGQLTLAFVDLADAIDRVRRAAGKPPVVIVWENVPGVFTIADNAFGCFLAGIVGDDQPVEPGPRPERGRSSAHWAWSKEAGVHRPKWTHAGYVVGPERAAAWRLQDAQYHGLAQRRLRVFVVASALEGFDPGAVLSEFDGVRRDSAPSRSAGQNVAGTLDARAAGGGFPSTDGACANHVIPADRRICGPAGVVAACMATGQGGAEVRTDDCSPTLTCNHEAPIAAYAFQPRIARNGRGDMGDLVSALTAQAGETGKGDAAPCVAYAIQERATCENPNAGPDGVGVRVDDCAYTLEARSVPQAVAHPPAIAFQERGRDAGRTIEVNGDLAYALTAPNGGGRAQERNIVDTATMAVRRLMPVECERLQGFPDNWTLVPTGARGKPAADGPRYKQCGNSMAVNVMRWIGRRIQAALPETTLMGHNGGPALDEYEALFG